jgi:hypothetical protein
MSLSKVTSMTVVGVLFGFLTFFICYWWIGSISLSVFVGVLTLIAMEMIFRQKKKQI